MRRFFIEPHPVERRALPLLASLLVGLKAIVEMPPETCLMRSVRRGRERRRAPRSSPMSARCSVSRVLSPVTPATTSGSGGRSAGQPTRWGISRWRAPPPRRRRPSFAELVAGEEEALAMRKAGFMEHICFG